MISRTNNIIYRCSDLGYNSLTELDSTIFSALSNLIMLFADQLSEMLLEPIYVCF